MGKKKPKKYSAQFKFTVVLEALKGEKMEGEIARGPPGDATGAGRVGGASRCMKLTCQPVSC